MAAAAILDFGYEVNSVSGMLFLVSVPNFVQLCLIVNELWPLK